MGLFRAEGSIALGGGRSLGLSGSHIAARLALAVIDSGRPLVVGCAKGADAAAVQALSGSNQLQIYSAWGANAEGSCGWSAVREVQRAYVQGSPVAWWAGGGPLVALSNRLSRRTRAVGAACQAGAITVWGSPGAIGTALLARTVAARGLPVLAVAMGFGAGQLPPLGAGAWAGLRSWPGEGSAAIWQPSQGRLL